MSTPYIGQVVCSAFNYAPLGWAFCDGRLLSVSQYSVLFSLIGTTYGGDGVNTFALPDLRGRTPVHLGPGYVQGCQGGAETVAVGAAQYPSHTHPVGVTGAVAAAPNPSGGVLAAAATGTNRFSSETPSAADALNGAMCTMAAGSSQPHDNRQPYLVCNWIIALEGEFPSTS
ncbi:MAG: phage tail protein [Bryobacteraceae bacterium]